MWSRSERSRHEHPSLTVLGIVLGCLPHHRAEGGQLRVDSGPAPAAAADHFNHSSAPHGGGSVLCGERESGAAATLNVNRAATPTSTQCHSNRNTNETATPTSPRR